MSSKLCGILSGANKDDGWPAGLGATGRWPLAHLGLGVHGSEGRQGRQWNWKHELARIEHPRRSGRQRASREANHKHGHVDWADETSCGGVGRPRTPPEAEWAKWRPQARGRVCRGQTKTKKWAGG